MQEQWTKWEPINNLHKKYILTAFIHHTKTGTLKINLKNNDNLNEKKEITFYDNVFATKESKDELIFRRLEYLKNSYGTDFYQNWTFFKVENSSFAHWLSFQSTGVYQTNDFIHCALITPNSIFDMILVGNPKINS